MNTWNWLENLKDSPYFTNILSTLALIIGILLLRSFALRSVRESEAASHETRLRWIVHIRNFTVILFLIGAAAIWAQELRSAALSFAALAVAFVISTKELILCLQGGFLRSSDRPFSVGDRIEIQEYRGDVVDQSMFTTTILEIGPGHSSHQYTGRAIVLPNSLFLSAPIINETFTDDYVLHLFTFPMALDDHWREAERALLRAAQEECQPFLAQAASYMEKLARNRGLETPNVNPRISLNFPEPGHVNLLVRIPAPARLKGRIEQAILRKFLDLYRGQFRGAPQAAGK